VQYTPPENDLWSKFLDARIESYLGVARYEWEKTSQAWKEGLNTQAGLKWLRQAAPERAAEQE
jgi:hypothetical protein